MRRRPSAWRRVGVLEARQAQLRPRQRRTAWDLERYEVTELEELVVLAAKAEASSGAPDWTAAEVTALERLRGKQDVTEGRR